VRRLLCAATLMVALVGCGPKSPDYGSIWTTTTTPTTTTSEEPVPFAQYLDTIGVIKEQVAPDKLPDLTVSMPTPPGWERHTSPNIPPTTEVITKGGPYPNAMLMVFKLTGDFDSREVAKHGNADVVTSANFKQLDASDADFHGFPSSMVQGTFDLEGKRLHTFNRVVMATGSPPARQRYLVEFSVTSLADQAVPESRDIESLIKGFTVAAK
jgi:hypothetical protein